MPVRRMPFGFFVPKNVRIRQKTAKMMMIEAKIDATIETMVLLLLLMLQTTVVNNARTTSRAKYIMVMFAVVIE